MVYVILISLGFSLLCSSVLLFYCTSYVLLAVPRDQGGRGRFSFRSQVPDNLISDGLKAARLQRPYSSLIAIAIQYAQPEA